MSQRADRTAATIWFLLLVTAVGIALRVAGLGQDLWIDELATLDDLRAMSPGDLVSSYTSANQHVLNSLLVWASIRIFGEAEWSVRLPALLFGVATIPAMYWLGRLARLGRGAALGGSALLALSYHHIWFSQNARGYTGYILFSLLATGALVRLLASRSARWILMFVVVSGLNFLALLPSLFVFGAQVLGAGGVLWAARRQGERDPGRLGRAAAAVGAATLVAVLVFTPLVTEIVGVLAQDAPRQVTAFHLFSLDFLREVLAGAMPGASAAWLLLAVLPGSVAVWGVATLGRRAPLITGVLIGAHVLFAGAILVLGWPVYPRLFILGLPLVILVLGTLLDVGPPLLPERWARVRPAVASLMLSLLVLGFGLMLPRLYRAPKQPYRAALAKAARLAGPEGFLVAVGVADRGVRFYAQRSVGLSVRVGYARTLEGFEAVLHDHQRRRMVLLSTFDRAMALETPELRGAMERGWQPSVSLVGTLRGGAVTIWVPRAGADSASLR